jgi:hypothetical protein
MSGTSYNFPILKKLEISWQFFQKYPNTICMKILPVGAELFHADRRKDQPTGGRNSANEPKNVIGRADVSMQKFS